MTAWLCYRCHTELDQGRKMDKEQKRDFMLTAICKTVRELWNRGLVGVIK